MIMTLSFTALFIALGIMTLLLLTLVKKQVPNKANTPTGSAIHAIPFSRRRVSYRDPRTISVVLASDNSMLQMQLYDGLKYLSINAIDITESSEDALALLRKDKYDLVLVDCQMKNSDGYQLIDDIREQGRCGAITLPNIISVSTHTEVISREKCESIAAMDVHLQKPLNYFSFEEALKQIYDFGHNQRPEPANAVKTMHSSMDSVVRMRTF